MNDLVESILDKKLNEAKVVFEDKMLSIVKAKLDESKKRVGAELSEQIPLVMTRTRRAEMLKRDVTESEHIRGTDPHTEHDEELDEARIAIVKARIRGGKVQRRKKVSNVAGYTLRGGQLTRMSPAERRNRRLGQRRGKVKRRAKMAMTRIKRQRSLRKRKSLGL